MKKDMDKELGIVFFLQKKIRNLKRKLSMRVLACVF